MDDPAWRTLSTGRCFVYLLPCREQDMLKIGFARDPWARMRAFHPRFHAFFDLDRGALIETDRVQEARAIETRLKRSFAPDRDIAPLAARERAGGKHEWFRGVHAQGIEQMRSASELLGYPFHLPLSDWLRRQWVARAEVIADWSRQGYEVIENLHFNADRALGEPAERAFRATLEAWESIGIPLDDLLAAPARQWYRSGFTD